MGEDTQEGFRERLSERPSFEPGKVLAVRPRHLAVRFAAGALTSAAAGTVTIALGARVGGILLAFPAILAASLTLIEEQEDSAEAREDARGAVVGGCALASFAAVGALAFGAIHGALVLVIASAVWLVVALAGYAALWWR